MSHSQVYKAEKLFMNSRLVKPRATCSILSNRFGCDLGGLTLFASYRLRLVIRIKYSRYCMSLCPSPAATSYSSALGTLLRLLFSNPFLFFLSHFCRLYHLSFWFYWWLCLFYFHLVIKTDRFPYSTLSTCKRYLGLTLRLNCPFCVEISTWCLPPTKR